MHNRRPSRAHIASLYEVHDIARANLRYVLLLMNTHSPSPPVSPPSLFTLLAGQREPRAGTSDDFDDVCETAIGFHTSLYLFSRALCVNLYLGCPVGIRRIYVRHAFSSLTEEPCHLLDRRCFALRNFVSMRNADRHDNCAKCRAVMATRGSRQSFWSFFSFFFLFFLFSRVSRTVETAIAYAERPARPRAVSRNVNRARS